jgi:hypothetical protein
VTQISSTRCAIEIVAPTGKRITFLSTQAEAQGDLLSVSVQKDLAQAVGSFSLAFAPRQDAAGRTWAERIPRRSLVIIRMERQEDPGGDPVDPTVMIGLTDDHGRLEDYTQPGPRRSVVITGREISGILLDAVLWFHPLLARDQRGSLSFLTRLLGQQTLALVWDPALSRGGEDPRVTLKRILEFFIFTGGPPFPGADEPQQPVINLQLPDRTLADVLDINDRQWNTFEPVLVPIGNQPQDLGAVWNYLQQFVDPAFQEFFTRIEDGICKIHFRGKPFQHELITSGTRFKSSAEEPTLRTVVLPTDGPSAGGLLRQRLHRQTAHVYNIFWVQPLSATTFLDLPSFKDKALPEVIAELDHPSSLVRYGIRVMHVASRYLSALPVSDTPTTNLPPPPPPPSQTRESLNATQQGYATLAARIALEEGLRPDHVPVFVALIHTESTFHPNAFAASTGASGLGQLLPSNPFFPSPNPFDPDASLRGAARYWLQLATQFNNDPVLIPAAYFSGPGGVISAGYQVPPFPKAQQHHQRVQSRTALYANIISTTAPATATPPAPGTTLDVEAVVATAQRWARILRGWYDVGGELLNGILLVRGSPRYNIGDRLVTFDAQGPLEFYIEGVTHVYDFRTGFFSSQLRVTRGWHLERTVTDATRLEGRVPVEEVS